jgi:hypothetical protein
VASRQLVKELFLVLYPNAIQRGTENRQPAGFSIQWIHAIHKDDHKKGTIGHRMAPQTPGPNFPVADNTANTKHKRVYRYRLWLLESVA